MSDCGYGCYVIGEGFVAENPDCPIHGVNGSEDRIRKLEHDLAAANTRAGEFIDLLNGALLSYQTVMDNRWRKRAHAAIDAAIAAKEKPKESPVLANWRRREES